MLKKLTVLNRDKKNRKNNDHHHGQNDDDEKDVVTCSVHVICIDFLFTLVNWIFVPLFCRVIVVVAVVVGAGVVLWCTATASSLSWDFDSSLGSKSLAT